MIGKNIVGIKNKPTHTRADLGGGASGALAPLPES